jgi:sodium/proline symporter
VSIIQIYMLSCLAYFALILFVGLRNRQPTDHLEPHLGGRTMGFWMTALSAHASDMSAWLFLSLPMLIWMGGAQQIWIALGLWIGMAANWKIISRRLREKTAQAQCYTLPAWFEHAFDDKTSLLKKICALLSTLFLLNYLAAGLIAMGLLMESLFGFDYFWATFLAALLMALYTIKGGFNAVATVDLFQALFLLAVIMIVPSVAVIQAGGWDAILKASQASGVNLNPLAFQSSKEILQAAISALGWGLGYFGMPHVLSKFMGIRDPGELSKSMVVGLVWQFLALSASVLIGVCALAWVGQDLSDPELLFVHLVQMLFHPMVAGVIFCAIMAANLSTMDSQLLVAGSVLAEDLLPKKWSEYCRLNPVTWWRLQLLTLALLSWLISCSRSPSVQEAVIYSWSGLGATYGPLLLWSLYGRKAPAKAAAFAVLAGSCSVILWSLYAEAFSSTLGYDIPALLPGFFAGFFCLGIFSFFKPKA